MQASFLTERQQVALAKTLSDPSSDHRACFADGEQVSASRSRLAGCGHQGSDTSATGMNFEAYSPASSASTEEKVGAWRSLGLPSSSGPVIQRTTSGGGRAGATKSTIKRRGRARFSAKSAILDARKTQKAVKEAASILLDISDRVPFTGVKSSGVKVWAKFDHDTRSCGTVKEVLRQGRWFLGQIKEGMKTEVWSTRQKEWVEACKQCADPKKCKTLVSELESGAIDWTAVARTWAMEQGLDVSSWPASWTAPGSNAPAPGMVQPPRVQKWRACCEARLDGKWRQLGLTFTLAVPSDVAAAGPERHSDDAGVTSEAKWVGGREDGGWDSRGGFRSATTGGLGDGSGSLSGSDDEEVELWDDGDSSGYTGSPEECQCDMQPLSPYHGSRCSDGTLEPVGSGEMMDEVGNGMMEPVGNGMMAMDVKVDIFSSEPCVIPLTENGGCPGVMVDEPDQLVADPDESEQPVNELELEGLWASFTH